MHPGSLSHLELEGLRKDMNAEIGDGNIGRFYRYSANTQGVSVSADGTVNSGSPTTIYEGPVEFSTITARQDRYETRLGEHIYIKQYRVAFPASVFPIPHENDRFVMLSSHADPALVGREMYVKNVVFDAELSKRLITLVDTDE